MEKILFNNSYIIISDNKLGNDFRCEYILKSLDDLQNQKIKTSNKDTINNKDTITKDKIDQIMNLGINQMFNKLFDCEYG